MRRKVSACGDMLFQKIKSKKATIAVLGLGFAGLPEACLIARAGSMVLGVDIDEERIDLLRRGLSPTVDVSNEELQRLQRQGYLEVTSDLSALSMADCVIVCVPTLLDQDSAPDLHFLETAVRSIAQFMREPQLIVITSTVPPGGTRKVVLPILEQAGHQVGVDFLLAFAPERVDPGSAQFHVADIPRLVSGITEECRECACALYSPLLGTVLPVSSVEVAEMAKLVENAFRFVNIGFVNEMAVLANKIGVNIWQVMDAAASKPFGFMRHAPGAGVGGACIPVTPLFLRSVAQAVGAPSAFISAAHEINRTMPVYVADRLEELMQMRGTSLHSARILVGGVTYKPGVPDLREAPALKIMELLEQRGAVVSYHDPLIDHLELAGRVLSSVPINEDSLEKTDAVVLVTPHPRMDYKTLLRAATLILDTSNALEEYSSPNVVPL